MYYWKSIIWVWAFKCDIFPLEHVIQFIVFLISRFHHRIPVCIDYTRAHRTPTCLLVPKRSLVLFYWAPPPVIFRHYAYQPETPRSLTMFPQFIMRKALVPKLIYTLDNDLSSRWISIGLREANSPFDACKMASSSAAVKNSPWKLFCVTHRPVGWLLSGTQKYNSPAWTHGIPFVPGISTLGSHTLPIVRSRAAATSVGRLAVVLLRTWQIQYLHTSPISSWCAAGSQIPGACIRIPHRMILLYYHNTFEFHLVGSKIAFSKDAMFTEICGFKRIPIAPIKCSNRNKWCVISKESTSIYLLKKNTLWGLIDR